MTTVLKLHQVEFAYEPQSQVINGISGQLEGGRITALIGPNAAGKSTLLRLMLGQLKPSNGQLHLDDTVVSALSPRRRAAWISYVPQHGSVNFTFTVQEVVEMGRFALTSDVQAVERAIDLCDLADLRRRTYATLSAGQQQRVLLARALAQAAGQGRVMLLDEPGSAMDLWHIHRTMRCLRELAQSGMAVLIVLHDLNLTARYADDVWLLQGGRLAATGPWQEVLSPAILEPIYRVHLAALRLHHSDRPVFVVDPDATL